MCKRAWTCVSECSLARRLVALHPGLGFCAEDIYLVEAELGRNYVPGVSAFTMEMICRSLTCVLQKFSHAIRFGHRRNIEAEMNLTPKEVMTLNASFFDGGFDLWLLLVWNRLHPLTRPVEIFAVPKLTVHPVALGVTIAIPTLYITKFCPSLLQVSV